MAYSPFNSTSSKTKKNNDDDMFSVAKKLAYNDVYGNKKQTSSTTYQSKVAAPTMPTVSSTVGNHTSSYGQYAADKSARKQEIESRLGQIQNEMTTVSSVLSGYSPTRQNSNAYALAKNKAYELTKERSELERELQALSKVEEEPATNEKYSLGQGAAGVLQKGLNQIAQAGGDTLALAEDIVLAPFELFSGMELGSLSDSAPLNTWAQKIREEGQYATDYHAANVKAGGKAAELFDQYGSATVAAAPQAVIAMMTGGTSAMAQTTTGLTMAAQTAMSPGVRTTITNTVSQMSKDPQYWTSFAQMVGGSYENAIADMEEQVATGEKQYDTNTIRTRAALQAIGGGLINAAIEVGGGIQKLPSEMQSGVSGWRAFVDSMLDEGKEEVLQGIVERATQNLFYDKGYAPFSLTDKNAVVSIPAAAEEFAGGAIVGGLLSGAQIGTISAANKIGEAINNKRVSNIGTQYASQERDIIRTGLGFNEDTDAYKMAEELLARVEKGEKLSSTDIGNMVVENARAAQKAKALEIANADPVVESDVETAPVQSRATTIQSRLAESGMDATQAETVATSIDRILSGDTSITNKDKNVLSVGNKEARAIFEEETGIKLPASNSSTRQAVSEYVAQTALKQEKQDGAQPTNVSEPVQQTDVEQEEIVSQLKPTPDERVREAYKAQDTIPTIGAKGQEIYQKHLGNAENVSKYTRVFQRYYDAGQIHQPLSKMETHYAEGIDPDVVLAAYNAGVEDASVVEESKPTTEKKNAQKGEKTPPKRKHEFKDVRKDKTTKTVSKEEEAIFKQFARAFNVNIELRDTIADSKGKSIANGYYDKARRTIVLAADSDNPLMTVLKHEVTHHIQKTSPKQYKAFKDYVMQAFYNNSEEAMNLEIQRRIDNARLNNVKLTRDGAMDEIVADATEMFLTDRDSIDALVRENRTLAQTILDAIRDVLHKIEAAMKGVEVTDRYSYFMNPEQLKQAEKMWVDALAASANSEISVNDVTITESSAPVWSLKSMKFDLLDGQMQRDLVEHGIMTLEESQHLMKQINDLIDHMSPFAHIVDMNEEYSKGNRPFNVYKPNSDPLYKVSLDFSTLCKKRLMTQFVMESLQTKLGKALSAKEQLAIRSKLEEYGKTNKQIQVACALCYVEARRLKAPDQINRFLDDRTTILTDYFGKKNKDYKASVDEMADRMKVELGYRADTKLKNLKPADKKKINTAKQKMMKEYTPTAEEQKIIERANAIDNAEFLSQAGLTRLSLNDPVIYDAFVTHVRNATKSKALEGGVPYYYGDSKSVSDSLINAMNAENGLRHQSWSDFEIIHLLDNIAAVIDLSVRKAKTHAYTKVPDFVKVNGNTGIMINLSLIPAGKTGIKDGKLDFSPTEGMDFDVAVELRDQYHKTTGTIAIGIDDQQITMMLDDDTIDYVIPYHTSGMNAQLRKMAGISGWADYESFQSEKEIKGAEQGDCPDELWHKKPDFSEWFDTSKLDMSKSGVEIMREAAGRYLVLCEERGLKPKFSDTKKHTDFSKHENYWKMLIDRKMVDGDGHIIIQQAVRPDFDFDKINEIWNAEVKAYDPTLLDSINEKIMKEWESGGIKQREKELLAEEKKTKKKAAKVANGLLEQVVAPDEKQFSLKLSKQEYRQVQSARMNKYAGMDEADIPRIDYVYARDQFYVVENFALDGFGAKSRINPEKESDLINFLMGVIDNGDLENFTGDSKTLKTLWSNERRRISDLRDRQRRKEGRGTSGLDAGTGESSEGKSRSGRGSETGGDGVKQYSFKESAAAEERFGTTTDFAEAGFILPNGKMLKLTDDNHRGERIYDHRAIGLVYGVDVDLSVNHGFNYESNKFLNEFVENGGIRFDAGDPSLGMDIGLQLSANTPLTRAQEQIIRELVEWKRDREAQFESQATEEDMFLYDGSLAIRIDFGGDAEYAVGSSSASDLAAWGKKSLEYEGGNISASRIINDIRHYYQTGEVNKPSSVAQFLYQLKTPDEMLDIAEQIRHEAKAVTDADIMSQAIKDIAKTDAEKKVVGDYQRAMKTLADYEKKLAVYEATKAEHSKGRSIYTDASGKVKKSGVKYSAAEKAEIQKKAEWWKKRLDEIEKRDEFKKILKREKAKMAETHARKMSDLRTKYNQRIDALREQRDAKVNAEKQKMRDYKQNQRDTKEYKALKAKLESDVKWLDERLRHPTDAKHIPEEFKKGVAAFLESLDFTTPWTDRYETVNGKPSQKVINLTDMKEAYKKILDDKSSAMELDETQLAALKELENICKNKRLVDLDYAELGLVRDAIEYIKMSVASADKAFNKGIMENISAMGESLIKEQRGKKARKDRAGIAGEADKLLNFDNVAPADKFHEFGGVMEKLYHEIRKGFDKHISNVQSTISYTQNLIKGNEDAIKEWSGKKSKTTKFQISDGTTIELTPAQVMSLYCLMKRDQAVGHILGSGIVPSDVEVKDSKKIGKVNLPAVKKLYSEKASRCTVEDIQKIVGTLTAEQKKIADGVVKLFTTKCADWGNETSMTLYGYKKFNDANYFPIKSSDAYLNARFDDSGDVLIKNLGFTKNTVVNANNPIVIDDIFNVMADHVNKMSMYNALVVPLTDFTRVFNYKSKGINKDGEVVIHDSVQKALEASGGNLGIQYIKQFMKDVNKQANSLAAESFINKSISRYKKAKIAASARVLLQQPTAITRAAAMVDPKYLIKGLQQKANYEEMFNHSEIAYWKSLGFYQTDMGRNMKDILLDNETALDRLTMGMYGKADDFAWGHLWNAIKLEQADANPGMDKTSAEFMDLVANRFEEVVDRTQVVDSVFHRSQIMRAPGAATKVATAFMAEPTKAFNLLRTDLIDSINSKDYSKIKRSAATYVANAILVSAFAGIADMIRDDEDEDDDGNKRNLWDKYRDATVGNIVDNINPLGMIPYVKELNSMIQGYDVSRMEMASLAEFVKTAKKWSQGKYSYPYLIKETAEDISELFGIPLKNAIRDMTALVRTAGDMVGGHYYADYMVDKMKYNIANSNNRSIFYKHYTDALMAGDEAAAEAILADMVMNGIPYDNIISKGYQKQKAVAFSEARKLIAEGKTDDAKKLIRSLAKQYDKKFSTLWKSVRDGDSADEPEETYDFKDLQKAIRKGEDTELIEDYLTEYGGYSEEALEEAVKLLTEKYQ